MSLYLEVIKHYIPEEDDYCSQFPDEALDLSEDIRHLDINDYFFEGLFPMLYCSKCYPDLPKAVLAMEALQKYHPEFDKDKSKDPSFYTDRQKALSDLKAIKATKKKEFITALKETSIMSKFDWKLHLLSGKHHNKEAPKAVGLEILDVKGILESIKQQIVALEIRMGVSQHLPVLMGWALLPNPS